MVTGASGFPWIRAQDEDHWFNNNKSCYKTFPSYNLRAIPDRFPDIRNPSKPQLNVALEKTFRFTERYGLQFRSEAFNVTNTAIRPGPNTDFNNGSFGKLTKMENNFPRVIQFAAKLFFRDLATNCSNPFPTFV